MALHVSPGAPRHLARVQAGPRTDAPAMDLSPCQDLFCSQGRAMLISNASVPYEQLVQRRPARKTAHAPQQGQINCAPGKPRNPAPVRTDSWAISRFAGDARRPKPGSK